ncbi:MAG TPA: DUF6088 family protein [Bacteroidales bacterium]|nr:DUF6088 family protein [Bacteroidales bacterium]HSA42109.1 DUF6088 family protein [Bacteroidales bacterium]
MGISIELQVLNKIKKASRGTLFFTDNFLAFGNPKAISKALQRLMDKGEIIRVATGIYVRPRKSSLFGYITPGLEEIADAISRRDKARIIPTGEYAINLLGLSTQVALNAVFLTDGAARIVKVGERKIKFKKTAPKNLATRGEISSLVIQGLRSIGKTNVNAAVVEKITLVLTKEKPENIKHDLKMAPEWIRQIFRMVLSKVGE